MMNMGWWRRVFVSKVKEDEQMRADSVRDVMVGAAGVEPATSRL